jgi:hypothetical protein
MPSIFLWPTMARCPIYSCISLHPPSSKPLILNNLPSLTPFVSVPAIQFQVQQAALGSSSYELTVIGPHRHRRRHLPW